MPVLRIGLSLVLLWFGLSQLTHPGDWVSWVPGYATALSHLSATVLVLGNGILETVLGVALLLGFWTRLVAFLLALHLLHLAITVGYNDIGVRDFGLAIAMLSVALHGADTWTLDQKFSRTE